MKYRFDRPIDYQPHATKVRWHSQARAHLRALARALELEAGTYDIRSSYGGIAVSGESTLHGDHVYVQISQSCMGAGHSVLYRRCNGRKDYTGARNHFASLHDLHNIEGLAAAIERNVGPCYKPNATEVK